MAVGADHTAVVDGNFIDGDFPGARRRARRRRNAPSGRTRTHGFVAVFGVGELFLGLLPAVCERAARAATTRAAHPAGPAAAVQRKVKREPPEPRKRDESTRCGTRCRGEDPVKVLPGDASIPQHRNGSAISVGRHDIGLRAGYGQASPTQAPARSEPAATSGGTSPGKDGAQCAYRTTRVNLAHHAPISCER